jgi:hypothetical protein
MTRFARDVSPERVWPDYPRPQLVRKDWLFELYNGSLNANPSVSLTSELAKLMLAQYTRDLAANTTGNDYVASFTTT